MNKEKLEECSKLLEDSMSVLQKDTELWKQFLQFATQFTYYRFRDQLLIYAQNQQATACATFAQWKRIGRYVRSGEHSIVLLDETGLKPKLRHVFDVMSTGPEKEFAYRPKPILSEEREEFAKQLSAVYAKENSSYFTDAQQWEGDLEHTLSQIALYMTQQYYGVSLEQAAEHSENGEIPTYYVATATSAMYLLLSKYGFEKEANQLDFSCMEQLDEKQFENVGTAASAILSRTARMIRQIHPQIQRETQTEKQPERSHENEERIDNRGYSQENHISSGGELYGTGHWTAGGSGEPIAMDRITQAVTNLYGGWEQIPESSRLFLQKITKSGNYQKEYGVARQEEINNKKRLIEFEDKYPGVTTSENVDKIIKNLKKKDQDRSKTIGVLLRRKQEVEQEVEEEEDLER